MFQSVYRHNLETKLFQKPWKQEIAKIPEWARIKAVAEFRMCVGHDCLGTHLHRIGIRPDPCCMLCSLHEPMNRNHLGQSTALLNRTECEAILGGQGKNGGKLNLFPFYYYYCDYSLLLGPSYCNVYSIILTLYFYCSHR